jgi:hypothetical protein
VEIRLARRAALDADLTQVDLVVVAHRTSARPAHVIDRRGPRDAEQPGLERARPLVPTQRGVGPEDGIVRDVLRVGPAHDGTDVRDHAIPLLGDDGREDRVEIGGG